MDQRDEMTDQDDNALKYAEDAIHYIDNQPPIVGGVRINLAVSRLAEAVIVLIKRIDTLEGRLNRLRSEVDGDSFFHES